MATFSRGEDYFDAEEYEYGPIDSNDDVDDAPLSWRNADSLSDWAIVVHDGDESATYHVHRNILAVGPRKSEYFSRLFRTKHRVEETVNEKSEIEMKNSAFEAFPRVLDYMYSPTGDLDVTTESAVALRHLAQYFGIRSLFKLSTDFIKNDLCPGTAPVYLSEATLHVDEKLAAAAADVCAQFMEQIETTLISSLSPELFEKVASSPKLNCDSEMLSKIVAEFCRAHSEHVDGPLLRNVTKNEIMPCVHAEVASYLLELSISHEDNACDKGSKLHDRCIRACSSYWENFLVKPFQASNEYPRKSDVGKNTELFANFQYKDLPLTSQVALLEESLLMAKSYIEKIRTMKNGQILQLEQQLSSLHSKNRALRVYGELLSKQKQKSKGQK